MIEDINAYLTNGELLQKLSDVTRIVDPLQKKVLEYKNDEVVMSQIHCFNFLGRNSVCENCISMRAYNDNTTYVKIEYTQEKTYLITAVPYDLTDRRIVIEIIKDITDSMLFDSFEKPDDEPTGIHALIDNMNKLAFSDPLTGLYNRRYIMEKLPVDLLNAALSSEEISVIMADIDFFKVVNDTYGHLAGDQTLKSVALTLSGCIKRSSDWVARFGGEEFLVCMPGADLDTARSTAESMRESIESTVIAYGGKQFSITASFGVHNLRLPGSESVDELINHADEKLYLAKNNGRNRVE